MLEVETNVHIQEWETSHEIQRIGSKIGHLMIFERP